MLRPGDVLRNRYRIESFLGRGGMSDVYLAFDLRRQVHVAVKVLREDLAEDPEFVRRFRREAEALAQLDHPYIVRFYSFERQGAVAFIVMDYVPGVTLRRRLLEAGGPLPLEEVTRILQHVGSALQYAHNEGFIHRDIKTGNIMLREDGTALLTDFGIARVAESATMTMGMVGTPAYMSPEQIRGEELDHRTDIYSLGVVLYEMMTGRRPFSGTGGTGTGTSTLEQVRHGHLHLPPPDPRQFNPTLPAGAAQVILRALAKKREERWPDVASMVRAWEEAVGVPHQSMAYPVRSTPARPVSTPMPEKAVTQSTRVGSPGWIIGGIVGSVVAVVLLILGVGVFGRPSPAMERNTTVPSASVSVQSVDIEGTARALAARYATETAEALLQKTAASMTETAVSVAKTVMAATETAQAKGTIEALAATRAAATAQALASTVTAEARLTATQEARIRARATRQARLTATAVAAIRLTATHIARVIVEQTRRAEYTLEAQRLTATAKAARATEAARVRLTQTAIARNQYKCFVSKVRHKEHIPGDPALPAGHGEIAGIVSDINGRPFTEAKVRIQIMESNWEKIVPINPDGIYDFCCTSIDYHNKYKVELIGNKIRMVRSDTFVIDNPYESRVLVDIKQVRCP